MKTKTFPLKRRKLTPATEHQPEVRQYVPNIFMLFNSHTNPGIQLSPKEKSETQGKMFCSRFSYKVLELVYKFRSV